MPSKRKRVHRIEKALAALPISPTVLREAFEDFRETGALPQAKAIAKAVIVWAESGVDPTRFGDEPLDREAMLRAYLRQPESERDPLMHQLRQEAVFADDRIRGIARIVLQRLAFDGCDPSRPLFEEGRIPKPVMTCPIVSLSMVRFPFGVVAEAYHPRLEQVLERLRCVRETLNHKDDEAVSLWFKRLEQAGEMLAAGGTVDDPLMREALTAMEELYDVFWASRKATAPSPSPDEGTQP